MLGPVHAFMAERGVETLRIAERFNRGHLNEVIRDTVERAVSAILHLRPRRREIRICMLDALDGRQKFRRRPRAVLLRQSVDLIA